MRETKFGKRCLTWVLIMMMTLSLLPVSALAEDGEELDEDATLPWAMFTSTDARDTDSENEFEEQGDDVTVNEVVDREAEDKASADIGSDDADDNETIEYDVSKSKTATQLNKRTWTSKVTLSLPSAEEKLASDIVFVLDTSDCISDVMDQVSELVTQLATAQENTGADIKVGVVVFKGSALPMFDGELVSVEEAKTTLDEINAKVEAVPKKPDGKDDTNAQEQVVINYLKADEDFIYKGSNLHSGLLGAQALLQADTAVADSRKYVVTVTDGMTYYWNDNQGNVYGIYSGSSANGAAYPSLLFYGWCEAYGISMKNPDLYKLPDSFGDWDSYLQNAKALEAQDNGDYAINIRQAKDTLDTNFKDVRFSEVNILTDKEIP